MITKIESNLEYHSSDIISASGLKMIYQSSVWDYNRKEFKDSDAMRLGSAVHCILLEPENFDDEFVFFKKDQFNLRTKAGRAEKEKWEEQNIGKSVLNEVQETVLFRIKERFDKHTDEQVKIAKKYFQGDIELSHYLNYDGVPVKVRPDCKGDDFISDIKTINPQYGKALTPDLIKREIWSRAYHLQAMFYSDMLERDPKNFRFIFIQTSKPYKVIVCGLTDEMIFQGRIQYQEALIEWKLYREQGIETKYKNDLAQDGSIIL